jgi:predicted alpha/beta superfamily hydrolase
MTMERIGHTGGVNILIRYLFFHGFIGAFCFFAFQENSFGQTGQTEICIAGTVVHQFVSKINSVPYRISVALPFNYLPSDTTRYPVMYVLDGDPNLPMAALIQRNMSYDHEVPDVIMVGVGYQVANFLSTRSFRVLDYTPSHVAKIDSEITASHHMKMVTGGAADFLQVLEKEIIPYIENNYKTNKDRSLAGHSLGGLFALYTLFHEPALFQKYLISSPSLYWNDSEMLGEETEYYNGRHKILQARIFISAGSLEPDPMAPDIKQLVNLLRQRHYQGLEITEYIFQDETHLSVIPYSFSRGMRIIYFQKPESTN